MSYGGAMVLCASFPTAVIFHSSAIQGDDFSYDLTNHSKLRKNSEVVIPMLYPVQSPVIPLLPSASHLHHRSRGFERGHVVRPAAVGQIHRTGGPSGEALRAGGATKGLARPRDRGGN